jgi:hypothetical protein
MSSIYLGQFQLTALALMQTGCLLIKGAEVQDYGGLM